MGAELRVCANCRVLVEPCEAGFRHVPLFAEKFTRAVCEQAEPGRVPTGSELRFGLARVKSAGGDKLALKGHITGLDQPAGAPVVVGVDGSYKLTVTGNKVIKPMSWAWLATNGQWGLGTSILPGSVVGGWARPDGSDPERTLQGELRAIANAVRAIPAHHPLKILSDSKDAINYLTLWRDGYDVMPGGYITERAAGRLSTLGRLARQIKDHPQRITWDWVRGHSGHPLNEGADALAKTARAWATGRLDRDRVAGDAPQVVLGALARYAQGIAA